MNWAEIMLDKFERKMLKKQLDQLTNSKMRTVHEIKEKLLEYQEVEGTSETSSVLINTVRHTLKWVLNEKTKSEFKNVKYWQL